MEVLHPPTDILPAPLGRGLRESSRKRVKKTLGPDFIEDFSGSLRNKVQLPDALEDAFGNKVLIKKEENVSPRKGPKKAKTGKKQIVKKAKTNENTDVHQQSGPVKLCGQCGLALPKSVVTGYYDGELRANTVHCTGEGCKYEVHAGCLAFNPLKEDRFQCPTCKRNQCVVCEKGNVQKDLNLVKCNNCRDVYHYGCHKPLITQKEVKPAEWLCVVCRQPTRPAANTKRTQKKVSRSFIGQPTMALPAPLRVPDLGYASFSLQTAPIPPSFIGPKLYTPHVDLIGTFRGFGTESILKGISEDVTPVIANNAPSSLVPMLMPGQPFGSSVVPDSMLVLGNRDYRLQERMEKDKELRQDMATWSVDQCAAFFQDSNPDLAQLILDHDLLGCALIVITRSQFLDLFQLPLGKAVKMHAAICRCRRMFF